MDRIPTITNTNYDNTCTCTMSMHTQDIITENTQYCTVLWYDFQSEGVHL